MQPGILEFTLSTLNNLGMQLFHTIILAVILTWLLYNPVKGFMRKRAEGISKQLSDASLAEEEASKLKSEYEDKLASIENERTTILDNARKVAKEAEDLIISEARQEAENIKNRTMQEIKLEKEKVKDTIRNEIIEVSTLIASKYIESSIDEATQNKLLDEVISDLGDAKWLS